EREPLAEERVLDLSEGALDAERLAYALGRDPVDRRLGIQSAAHGQADVEQRDEGDHVRAEGTEEDEPLLRLDQLLVLARDQPLEEAEEPVLHRLLEPGSIGELRRELAAV